MIQQLFPGRTRHQVKLKFKKEERQYPIRLSEALASRANGSPSFLFILSLPLSLSHTRIFNFDN